MPCIIAPHSAVWTRGPSEDQSRTAVIRKAWKECLEETTGKLQEVKAKEGTRKRSNNGTPSPRSPPPPTLLQVLVLVSSIHTLSPCHPHTPTHPNSPATSIMDGETDASRLGRASAGWGQGARCKVQGARCKCKWCTVVLTLPFVSSIPTS